MSMSSFLAGKAVMNKDKSIYVIRRNNGNAQDHDHYVTHGTIGGMEDAIGYGKLSDARKNTGVYVIRRNCGNAQGYDHYVTHGTMGGMKDAIGYDCMEYARKFLSEKSAKAYIDSVLPPWGRDLHHPAKVTFRDAGLTMPVLTALLHLIVCDAEIPMELLEPAKGRLLIWRR